MQCFMEKEDKSLINVEPVETTYFDNCAFFAAFALFFAHPSQSCFSCILCNLLHLPLWCVHCFIMLALSISTSLRLMRAD